MTATRGALLGGRDGNPVRVTLPGLWALFSALVVAIAVGSVLAIDDSTAWFTTYAGSAPEAALADLAAGLGLLALGLYLGAERSGRRLGAIALLASAAWLSADLVGWQSAATHLRTLAMAAGLFITPLLLHMVAVAPDRRPISRLMNVVVLAGYAVAAGTGAVVVVAVDPSNDPACWSICSANPLLLVDGPGRTETVLAAAAAVSFLGGLAIFATAVWRIGTATDRRRRDLRVLLIPALAVGLTLGAHAAAAMFGIEGPNHGLAQLLFGLSAWSVTAMAAGVALVVRRNRRVRMAIQELAARESTGGPSGSATEILTTATGDKSLEVAYRRSPDIDAYVDARGAPVEMSTDIAGRARTPIASGGEVVAVIDHDPELLDPGDLAEFLGPAARLALANERLDAELLAQLRDLRESRARIVAAGDRERVRRERDLHDGAQQRLLALTYDLRTARAAAEGSADPSIASHLDSAIEAVHVAHDELRELAHGIYPAVLAEAGLDRALESLVERAPIPLRLEYSGPARCASETEMTTYVIADELLRDATRRGATGAQLLLERDEDTLIMEVHDDGLAPGTPIVHGQDRAGAMGGRLTLTTGTNHDVLIRLEVPCALS